MKKEKRFNWIGFIALIIWDIGVIQYLFYAMTLTNNLLSLSSETSNLKLGFSMYYVILFIVLIIVDLCICRNNVWMIILGSINLLYYGIGLHFNVSPISIIGCILIILAGIYGLKNSESKKEKI